MHKWVPFLKFYMIYLRAFYNRACRVLVCVCCVCSVRVCMFLENVQRTTESNDQMFIYDLNDLLLLPCFILVFVSILYIYIYCMMVAALMRKDFFLSIIYCFFNAICGHCFAFIFKYKEHIQFKI